MLEFLGKEITKKLLIIVLMIVGGTAFVVSRIVLAFLDMKSTQAIIESIRKNPSKAKKFSAALDIPYGIKENFLPGYYDQLMIFLKSIQSVGDYKILHRAAFELDQILVIIELQYVDYDVTVTGKSSDVSKKAWHNFLLKYDREKNQLTVYSNIHSDLAEKIQKEGFIKSLFTGVTV